MKKFLPLYIVGTLVIASLGVSIAVLSYQNNVRKIDSFVQAGPNVSKSVERNKFFDLVANAPALSEYKTKSNLVENPYMLSMSFKKTYMSNDVKKEINAEITFGYWSDVGYLKFNGKGDIDDVSGLEGLHNLEYELFVSNDNSLFRICRYDEYTKQNLNNDPNVEFVDNCNLSLLAEQSKWIKFDIDKVEVPQDKDVESVANYYAQLAAYNDGKLINAFDVYPTLMQYLSSSVKTGVDSNYLVNKTDSESLEKHLRLKSFTDCYLKIDQIDGYHRKVSLYYKVNEERGDDDILITYWNYISDHNPTLYHKYDGNNFPVGATTGDICLTQSGDLYIANGSWVKYGNIGYTLIPEVFTEPEDTFALDIFHHILGIPTFGFSSEIKYFSSSRNQYLSVSCKDQDISLSYGITLSGYGDLKHITPTPEVNSSEIYYGPAKTFAKHIVNEGEKNNG